MALLALTAALLWLPSTDTISASDGQTVPSDWALIPDGIEPGDSFRLLFVTSATRDASVRRHRRLQRPRRGRRPTATPPSSPSRTASPRSSPRPPWTPKTTPPPPGRACPSTGWAASRWPTTTPTSTTRPGTPLAERRRAGNSYTGLVWTGGNKAGRKVGQEVRRGRRGAPGRPERHHPAPVLASGRGVQRVLPPLRPLPGLHRGRAGA